MSFILNKNHILEVEYNNFLEAKARPVLSPQTNGSYPQGLDLPISEIHYIKYGDSILVVYNNGKIAVVNSIWNRTLRGRQFVSVDYLNLTDSQKLRFVIECDDTEMFAIVYTDKMFLFDFTSKAKKGEITLPAGFKTSFAESPRGLRLLVLVSDRTILIYNLDTFALMRTLEMPKSEPQGTKWMDHLPGTNIFISKRQVADKQTIFSAFSFNDTDPYFCHRTCQVSLATKNFDPKESLCPVNFKPCSKLIKFFYTVLITLVVFMSVLILLYIFCLLISPKLEDETIRDSQIKRLERSSNMGNKAWQEKAEQDLQLLE